MIAAIHLFAKYSQEKKILSRKKQRFVTSSFVFPFFKSHEIVQKIIFTEMFY